MGKYEKIAKAYVEYWTTLPVDQQITAIESLADCVSCEFGYEEVDMMYYFSGKKEGQPCNP